MSKNLKSNLRLAVVVIILATIAVAACSYSAPPTTLDTAFLPIGHHRAQWVAYVFGVPIARAVSGWAKTFLQGLLWFLISVCGLCLLAFIFAVGLFQVFGEPTTYAKMAPYLWVSFTVGYVISAFVDSAREDKATD